MSLTQTRAVGLEEVETVKDSLWVTGEAREHVQEGNEERSGEEVTAEVDEFEETDLPLGDPVANSPQGAPFHRGGPIFEGEIEVVGVTPVEVSNLCCVYVCVCVQVCVYVCVYVLPH